MKFEKLKEHHGNRKKYDRLSTIFGLVALAMTALWAMYVVGYTVNFYNINWTLVVIVLILNIISLIISGIFSIQERRYSAIIEDYVVIKMMDVINEYGIGTDNFEIIKQDDCYKIAFHNQHVDYDELNRRIEELLNSMTKIIGATIEFKLI